MQQGTRFSSGHKVTGHGCGKIVKPDIKTLLPKKSITKEDLKTPAK
jgi:hypothetical protein